MPGFDRRGPLGAGPMTGGRRGLCVSPENRDRLDVGVTGYGVGRGGRPYGGGRGRAYGGGRGFRQQRYWDDPRTQPAYPTPVEQAPSSLTNVIGGILDRLNELGETVAALYDRFESKTKKTGGEEDKL